MWIRQVGSSGNVQIFAPPVGARIPAVTVTPDGNSVDFVRREAGGRARSLWRVPFLGGAAQKLVDDTDSAVGWSPDGRQLAFIRANLVNAGHSDLILGQWPGSSTRSIATRVAPAGFATLPMSFTNRPAWSDDRKLIAVGAFDDSSSGQLLVVDAVTAAVRVLATGKLFPVELVWGGSSSLVVSAKETEDKPFQLFRVAYPNGDILRLTNGLDNYVGVSVTADHNSLVSARRELRAVSGSSTKMASVPGSLHVKPVPPLGSEGWHGSIRAGSCTRPMLLTGDTVLRA